MTNQFLEQKFKELIYHFGEVNWDIIKTESWDKYINNQESFTEKQFEDLRYFVKDLLDCLTDKPKHEKLSQSDVSGQVCQHNWVGINQIHSYCTKCKITVED